MNYLNYLDSHEWVKAEGNSATVGTTNHAQDHLGKVLEVNEELNDSLGTTNSSPYDKGWIIKVEVSDSGELKSLMDADQYTNFCEEDNIHRVTMAMKNFGQFSCRGCSWIITINYTILEVCGAHIFLSIFIQTCAFTVLLLLPKSYKFSGFLKQIIILGF